MNVVIKKCAQIFISVAALGCVDLFAADAKRPLTFTLPERAVQVANKELRRSPRFKQDPNRDHMVTAVGPRTRSKSTDRVPSLTRVDTSQSSYVSSASQSSTTSAPEAIHSVCSADTVPYSAGSQDTASQPVVDAAAQGVIALQDQPAVPGTPVLDQQAPVPVTPPASEGSQFFKVVSHVMSDSESFSDSQPSASPSPVSSPVAGKQSPMPVFTAPSPTSMTGQGFRPVSSLSDLQKRVLAHAFSPAKAVATVQQLFREADSLPTLVTLFEEYCQHVDLAEADEHARLLCKIAFVPLFEQQLRRLNSTGWFSWMKGKVLAGCRRQKVQQPSAEDLQAVERAAQLITVLINGMKAQTHDDNCATALCRASSALAVHQQAVNDVLTTLSVAQRSGEPTRIHEVAQTAALAMVQILPALISGCMVLARQAALAASVHDTKNQANLQKWGMRLGGVATACVAFIVTAQASGHIMLPAATVTELIALGYKAVTDALPSLLMGAAGLPSAQ